MVLFVLVYEVLLSADIGQSLKNTSLFHILECGYLDSGSILTAWEPLAIHPGVMANRALMGLGCSFKKWDH